MNDNHVIPWHTCSQKAGDSHDKNRASCRGCNTEFITRSGVYCKKCREAFARWNDCERPSGGEKTAAGKTRDGSPKTSKH